MRTSAVVLAGYAPGKVDALAQTHGVPARALIPIAGRPMVSWTVQALLDTPQVGPISLVGLAPDDGLSFPPAVRFVTNHRDQLSNILAGIDALPHVTAADFVLIVSADVPLLRPATVQWFLSECARHPADGCYSIVSREVMEDAYPGSKRTFVRLRDGQFCGGDVSLVRVGAMRNNERLIRDLFARRKSAWQLARTLGLGVLFKFLFRRLSIAEAEAVAERLLGARVKAIASPHADLAMDVDQPEQLAYVTRLLETAQREHMGTAPAPVG